MARKNKRSEQWNMCKREGCGTMFHPWANKLTQEYCGNHCKCVESRKHRVMVKKVRPDKVCAECSTVFTPKRDRYDHCGAKCAHEYTWRLAREAYAAKLARVMEGAPQSKKEARDKRTRYYQGKICPKNHPPLRYTKSGKCVACCAAYDVSRGGRKSSKWLKALPPRTIVLGANWTPRAFN